MISLKGHKTDQSSSADHKCGWQTRIPDSQRPDTPGKG